MPMFGIDGLASGLDTTGMIDQLMALERQPITRLENQISLNKAAITSLSGFRTVFDGILAKAKELVDGEHVFDPVAATSSHSSVAATAQAGSTPTSFSFTVERLASAHQVVLGGTATDLDQQVIAPPGATLSITDGGGTVHAIDVGDGTLKSVIAGINATTGLGVRAQSINLGTGNGYKLQLTSTESGAASAFTVNASDFDVAFGTGTTIMKAGQDAMISVGGGAFEITSESNTFSDVVDGMSFTVSEADSARTVTVTTKSDSDAVVKKVKSLVDNINAALNTLEQSTDSGSDGKAGPLANDPTLRSLSTQLLTAFTYAVGGSALGSAGAIGIESTRDGRLKFDEAKFTTALAERPDDVRALFRTGDASNPGVADRIAKVAGQAVERNTGLLDSAIASRTSRNTTLQDSIDRLDVRLELRRTTMERQWAALEVALSGMQAQGNWLSSQLPALQANAPGNNR
ncbi:flagellar filament capping protein FliD [Euzebya sp.]|uniref:flagellar filament capping protein FliD n=1 Tax=Euzebya sp. TaxID=1971409 RepID=UPI00351416EB